MPGPASWKFDPEDIYDELDERLRPGSAQRVTVPDVVGKGVRAASSQLARLGLEVRTEMVAEHPPPVEGRVVRQSVTPGSRARRGQTVTLVLDFPEADA